MKKFLDSNINISWTGNFQCKFMHGSTQKAYMKPNHVSWNISLTFHSQFTDKLSNGLLKFQLNLVSSSGVTISICTMTTTGYRKCPGLRLVFTGVFIKIKILAAVKFRENDILPQGKQIFLRYRDILTLHKLVNQLA